VVAAAVSFRYTLILLVVAIVAIAGFGIAQRAAPPQPAGPPVTPTPVLVDLGGTDVTDLDVKIGSNEADFTKTNGQWTLTKPPDNSLLDQAKIDALATELSTLHGSRVVGSGGTDLQQFGLNNPKITVTLTGGSKKQTVLVGDASVDGSQYYAMTQGGSDVELVSGGLVTTMNALVSTPPKVTPTPSGAASASPAASPAASS
jgi:hypothetical protein